MGGRRMTMTYGAWLRSELTVRGVTQYALAKAAGVSLGRVNDYLRGTGQPNLENARRICRALGAALAALDRAVDLAAVERAVPTAEVPTAKPARGKGPRKPA